MNVIAQRNTTLATGLLVAAAAMSGCGGGNGSGLIPGNGNNGGNGGTNNLPLAISNLQDVTSDNSITEADRARLNTARANFQGAVQSQPNNGQAKVGLALTLLAQSFLDNGACFTSALENRSSTKSVNPADLLNITDLSSSLSLDGVSADAIQQAIIGPLKDVLSPQSKGTRGIVTTVRNCFSASLLNNVSTASDLLTQAAQSNTVSFAVFRPTTARTRTTLRSGDIRVLGSALQILSGVVSTALAYNLDPEKFYDNKTLASFDVNHDLRLTPNEYIAPSPFGTLRGDGASRLTSALAALRTGTTRLDAAIQVKLAESDSSTELLPLDSNLRSRLNQARGQVRIINGALTGPYSLPINGTTVTIDAQKFFQNPISDFRTVAPTLRLTTSGEVTPISFPNPTFNGIFPGGINPAVFG